MNILLALSNFKYLTGSELYTYELARCLVKRGHQVTIMANDIGGTIGEMGKIAGVQYREYFDQQQDLTNFDCIHTAQPSPTVYCLYYYPETPIITTIHSSLSYERPILDSRIRRFICVRPEVKEKIITEDGISVDRAVVVYNGVDRSRFKPLFDAPASKTLLFVGTYDHLRAKVIEDLIYRTESEGMQLHLVGDGMENRFDSFPHVKTSPSIWNVETYTQACELTASIYLGRTTIEGYLCNKPGLIYDVDANGKIKGVDMTEVPAEETLKMFDAEYMTDKILDIYTEAIG